MKWSSTEEGFTLLETLIAFIILSASMAIVVQTIAVATKSMWLSREKNEAVRLIGFLRSEYPSGSGKLLEGRSGSMQWRIDHRSLTAEVDGPAFAITTISTPSGRQYRFVDFDVIKGRKR